MCDSYCELTTLRWGYYVFGCVAMFLVFYTLADSARSAALSLGNDVHRAYITSAAFLIFLWFIYPIAWVSPNTEDRTELRRV